MIGRNEQNFDEQRLRLLIRQVTELEQFNADVERERFDARPIAFRRRWAGWLSGLAAAAAILLVFVLPGDDRPNGARNAVFLEVEDQPGAVNISDQRIDTYHSCSDEDAYALVLYRAWEPECACVTWGFYEFADASGVVELPAGETLDIPFDAWGRSPIDQCIVVAVSNQRHVLPADSGETQQLLACLHEITPADDPEEASACYANVVAGCLPSAVTVLTEDYTEH